MAHCSAIHAVWSNGGNPLSLQVADYRPATKRLLLDFSKDPTLGGIDNLECLSFGPKLANGHQTLVVASDNNFNRAEFTQFLAFEILP